MTVTIELTASDVSEAIKDYLRKKGYTSMRNISLSSDGATITVETDSSYSDGGNAWYR